MTARKALLQVGVAAEEVLTWHTYSSHATMYFQYVKVCVMRSCALKRTVNAEGQGQGPVSSVIIAHIPPTALLAGRHVLFLESLKPKAVLWGGG